jgi:hypothetical protein
MKDREKAIRGSGGKRIVRVNVSITNRNDSKLRRLATACDMKPTTLAGMLIEIGLNDARLVSELQREYCKESAYRVIVVNNNGELNYVLSGREDLR